MNLDNPEAARAPRDHLVAADYTVELLLNDSIDHRLEDGWLCDVHVPLVSLDQIADDLEALAKFAREMDSLATEWTDASPAGAVFAEGIRRSLENLQAGE